MMNGLINRHAVDIWIDLCIRLSWQRQEQLRLAKIQSLQKTDLHNAMESFVQTQRDLEETAKTKEEIAAENREQKLKEKLERLRLRKEHAAEVRRRKAEAARAGITTTTEEESLKQMSGHGRVEMQQEGFRAAVSSSANAGGWEEADWLGNETLMKR